MNTLLQKLDQLTSALKVTGAICLVGMMALTCADVVGRYFGHPIFGSVEIVGFMATLAVALALPYTHQEKGHIGVEILVRLFSAKTQSVIELITSFISLALFAVVTWRMAVYARTMQKSGEVSMNLQFPEAIIIYVTAFCFLMFALMILQDIAKSISYFKKG
jgi:TRAP-type C4-dicarboxylate transport system permease small subunit